MHKDKLRLNRVYLHAFFGILALLLALIYGPLLVDNYFIIDDFDWLFFGSRVAGWSDLLTINPGHFYDPMINLYFWLTYKFFGLTPQLHYLANIFLHAINSWLIFVLLTRFIKKRYAFLLMLLFAFQYFGSEVLFLINSATHLLVSMWILLSLLAIYYYSQKRSAWFLWAYLVTTLLALLTKEIAYILPVIQLMWLYLLFKSKITNKRGSQRVLKVFWPLLGTYFIYGIFIFNIFSSGSGDALSHISNPNFIVQIKIIFLSAISIFFYWPAGFIWPHILAGLMLLALWFRASNKQSRALWLFGLTWMLVYLIYLSYSVSDLVVSLNVATLIPRRYGYIVSVGLMFLLAGWFTKKSYHTCKVLWSIILSVLLVYNVFGIWRLDSQVYSPMSDISFGLTYSIAPGLADEVDTVYILDGFPWDPSNYLYEMLSVFHSIDPKDVVYVYTDKRNGLEIDRDSGSYIVLVFDYQENIWQVLEIAYDY